MLMPSAVAAVGSLRCQERKWLKLLFWTATGDQSHCCTGAALAGAGGGAGLNADRPAWGFALLRLSVAAASWPPPAAPNIPACGHPPCGNRLQGCLCSTQGVFTRPQIIQMDRLHGRAQVSRTSFCESFHRITHHYFLHRLHAYSCDRFLSDVSL